MQRGLQYRRIATVEISGTMLQGEYREETQDVAARFVTPRVDTDLARELSQYDVDFKGVADNTLLRAGRFDRQVLVDRPDKKGRIAILRIHLKKILLADDVDEEHIAAAALPVAGQLKAGSAG